VPFLAAARLSAGFASAKGDEPGQRTAERALQQRAPGLTARADLLHKFVKSLGVHRRLLLSRK
jgi:hypothetical protein